MSSFIFFSISETYSTLSTILGVVNDPTTAGVADSTQALTYLEPKKEE